MQPSKMHLASLITQILCNTYYVLCAPQRSDVYAGEFTTFVTMLINELCKERTSR